MKESGSFLPPQSGEQLAIGFGEQFAGTLHAGQLFGFQRNLDGGLLMPARD